MLKFHFMALIIKRCLFWLLVTLYFINTYFVYTSGTENDKGEDFLTEKAIQGKALFQKHNCTACHQIYGLGGYMGPDLTNIISAKWKGEQYARAFIQNGTQRMPNYHLTNEEIDFLIAYLTYVDKTGVSPVKKFEINKYGAVIQK